MESITTTVTCPACPTGGTCFATFDNIYSPGIISGQDLCISLDAQISGNLTVCGTINSNAAAVFSYSSETQTVGVPAPTFEDITFTDDPIINGWTHTLGDSTFTCLQAGNYLIEYDAICRITDSQLTDISIIALQNGSEIAGSQGSIQQPTNNRPLELTRSFIVSFAVNDTLKLQFTGGTQFVQLEANSGNSSILTPVNGIRPSITLTISKVS
jgi:hypothetical protein